MLMRSVPAQATTLLFVALLAWLPVRRATAQTPVTVKYMTWWWAEKGRNDAWRGIVKKFHDAQKDIRIQEVGFPYSEFFQRVTTQLAGGRLDADVLSFYDELGIRLIKTGALSPVDDVVQKLGIQEKLDKTVHQFVTSGGKLYGLLGVRYAEQHFQGFGAGWRSRPARRRRPWCRARNNAATDRPVRSGNRARRRHRFRCRRWTRPGSNNACSSNGRRRRRS